MRRLIVMGLVLACAGCSAVPPNFNSAPPVPADRVFDQALTVPGTEKGEIYLVRWTDAAGAAIVDARVYIDGQRVANLAKGEGFRAFVSSGNHTVGVKVLGLDSAEQPVRTRDVAVAAGDVHRYEIFWAGGGFDIQPHL
ncbi:hypothetical protein [Luteibacter sp.]|uniref:hypothetical protein n=1 Tax=Luteibacter sp. TaxID=1886636 RepID=UPI0025B9E4EA|nr:hypothetical protein [Luteibacter sp.]